MLLLYALYIQVPILFVLANSTFDSRGFAQPIACRNERRMYLLFDQYKADTCARCYNYMPDEGFKVKLRYNNWKGILKNPITNETLEATPFNTSAGILDSFLDPSYIKKWKMCCKAAIECCERMIKTPPPEPDGVYCPRTWDGWQCWDDTPGGTTANQTCKAYIYFQTDPPSCEKYSYKVCWDNGTWYLNDEYREWSNYIKCGRGDWKIYDAVNGEHRRFLNFHIATYSISVVSMVPALIIFSVYKQLQVPRITMHKNLFLSLFFNGIGLLLFMSIVVLDEFNRTDKYKSVMEKNGALCKFSLILTKYFRMTNYMWMFCEGFYLHKLIAASFAEQKNLIMFYLIGWVLPVFPVGIYAVLRKLFEDELCWTFPVEHFEWIINTPNLLSLIVNLFFLCNIIRVLITKLRATNSNEPNHYRKAVRATIILVPLFGLQFFLVIYRPQSGPCTFLEAYTYFSHATDGLQGFLVSLFFCYMNGEVLYLLKRSYQRFKLRHSLGNQNSFTLNPLSMTQVSSMAESQVVCQSGLHYRTKKNGKQGDAKSCVPAGDHLQEDTTQV